MSPHRLSFAPGLRATACTDQGPLTNDSVLVEYWNGAQWVMGGRSNNRPMFIRSLMDTTTRNNPGVSIREGHLDGGGSLEDIS